ncbi:hypothetical protein GGER_03910 [Serratia rubidaea]
MISMRRRLLLMLALILLVTQLISALWLWHESREQIGFLVDETLSAQVRTEKSTAKSPKRSPPAGAVADYDDGHADRFVLGYQLDHPPA